MPGLIEVGGKVPGQLRKPRARRVPGHAQQVDPACPVFDHERHIQPGQGERAVHVQEVDRQDGLGMSAEKCTPAVVMRGRRRDPPATQDLADRTRADPVSETAQLVRTNH